MEGVVVSSAVKVVVCESLQIVESLREPSLFGKEGVSGTYPIPIVRMSGIVSPIIRLQQAYPHIPSQATLDLETVAAVVVAPEIDVDADIGNVVVHGEHAAADEHKTEIAQTDFSESDQASPSL